MASEEEIETALIFGNDLSMPCHKNSDKKLSAKSLRVKFGYSPLTNEQKEENLQSNLDSFI